MISEAMMEDAIAAKPDTYLGEEGLKLIARQYMIGSYRFDLLFEDRHGAKVIVEIQKGNLDRSHTYKILDYYHEYKEQHPDEYIDLIVVANVISSERKNRLQDLGITYKEIPLKEFPHNASPNDNDMISSVDNTTYQHENMPDKIDIQPLQIIDKWLRSRLDSLPLETPIVIGDIARQSRGIAKIHDKGNAKGMRILLTRLADEGRVVIFDGKYFKVIKK